MIKTVQGAMQATGKKFALVASRFNELVTGKLVEGAQDSLMRHGANEKDIVLYWVPGAFETAFVARQLAGKKKYDAVICLGAVIRGDTPHFDYVATEAAKGVAQTALSTGVPTVFGILTCDTLEQALERAGSKSGNKGRQAAEAAIELVNLKAQL